MTKIMIVDDSLFMRSRIAKVLRDQEYETVTAGDGVEAVSTYKRARPDLVLMDYTMPRKNGLDALVEIRQFDPQSRIIMLTALDQKEIAIQAIQYGAKDFLVKPIAPARLILALQKALR